MRILATMLILAIVLVALTGCAAIDTTEDAELTVPEGLHVSRPIRYDMSILMEPVPEGLGITLEYAGYNQQALSFIITNNSGYDIRYGDGFELSGNQWGSVGIRDFDSYDLPSGEQCEIKMPFPDARLLFDEFQLIKSIIVDPENPADSRAYRLSAQFAIENPAVPPDLHGVMMEADFESPVGAVIVLTNGFGNGRVYYDNSYQIQQKTADVWRYITLIGSDAFLDDAHCLSSRQILQLPVYWAWLYGELPPGEYRIGKSVLHRTEDGENTRYDLFADFVLDGEPIPGFIRRNGSDWVHQFSGISTFRAEVVEHLYTDVSEIINRNECILVNTLTPVVGDEGLAVYQIWDNAFVTVLNSGGKQIRFSDIPQGAIVDISFSGIVLLSIPPQIQGALLIKIVG